MKFGRPLSKSPNIIFFSSPRFFKSSIVFSLYAACNVIWQEICEWLVAPQKIIPYLRTAIESVRCVENHDSHLYKLKTSFNLTPRPSESRIIAFRFILSHTFKILDSP